MFSSLDEVMMYIGSQQDVHHTPLEQNQIRVDVVLDEVMIYIVSRDYVCQTHLKHRKSRQRMFWMKSSWFMFN